MLLTSHCLNIKFNTTKIISNLITLQNTGKIHYKYKVFTILISWLRVHTILVITNYKIELNDKGYMYKEYRNR